MIAKRKPTKSNWIDPDDAPELTPKLARRAQIAIGGRVVREASGTVTKRGRPPVGDETKQQVTLRLAPRVINYFKETGRGWQTRLNETLEEYVTAAVVADVRRTSVSLHELLEEARARAKSERPNKVSSTTVSRNANTGRFSTTRKSSGGPKRTGSDKR